MRTQNLMVTALVVLGASAGAAGCSGGAPTTVGMRYDGVKVECTQTGDGVSSCTPAAAADPCDVVNVLWPPNHKMIQFTLSACAPPPSCGDGGDGGPDAGSGSGEDADIIFRTEPSGPVTSAAGPSMTAKITSITVDEAVDVGAGGDGHTANSDVQIVDPVTFALRSERQGGGDGRVYRVNFADDMGVSGSCEFQVPHDQGPAHGAIDSGVVISVAP